MKIKFLIVVSAFACFFAACQPGERQANVSNAQPSASPTAAPIVSETINANQANQNQSIAETSNQLTKPTPDNSPTAKSTTTAETKNAEPTKYKNYTVRGTIKKIDAPNNSVTIDHEDIGDYMVAMEMPFPVVNKNILDGLKVGDKVTFVLETGTGVERIVSIRKQ